MEVKYMKDSEILKQKLTELKNKRKSGEITEREYYIGLLELVKLLIDKLEGETISDKDVKKQIPLIVLFITDQISKMEGREH
jgi:hypothetical protein